MFEKLCYMRVQQTHKYDNINITVKNSHHVCKSMHYFTNNFHDELITGAEQVKKNIKEHWHYCLTETKIFSCLFLWGEGPLTNTPKTFFQYRHLIRELKIIHWATMFDFGFERLGWGEGTCKKHFLFLLPSHSFFLPITHSVRKSVSVSKPFVKNTERTAYSLGPGSAHPCLAKLV